MRHVYLFPAPIKLTPRYNQIVVENTNKPILKRAFGCFKQ